MNRINSGNAYVPSTIEMLRFHKWEHAKGIEVTYKSSDAQKKDTAS